MKKRTKIVFAAIGGVLAASLLVFGLVISHTTECPAPGPDSAIERGNVAVVHRCYGSPDILEFANLERPEPAGTELLVRIKAASVNPLDWHYMRGSPYLMRLGSGLGAPEDIRVGVDFAGVVEAVGPAVTRFAPGDRIFGGGGGAFAEYLSIDESAAIAAIPDKVSFEQAAALPIAAITALQALRDKGRVKPGQKVLINGASGGVGTFAVQIARAMGAEVHGVCSARNVELVSSLGATRVYDYRQENYTESGENYDLIVDMVGNHSIGKNRRALKPDGRLVIVGGPKGNWIAPLKRPLGALLHSFWSEQDLLVLFAKLRGEDLEELAAMVAGGDVRPVIDHVFPLEEAADAIRYSETGRARGKIIVDVDR